MTENAVVMNIQDMIDLAIGTPEVGVVDFNLLHSVLHCLAQQQNVLQKTVEMRGSLVPLNRETMQTVHITEYAFDVESNTKKDEPLPPPSPAGEETMLVVQRVKRESPTTISPTRGSSKTVGTASPRNLSPREKLSLVTMNKFNVLESTVDDLKKRVYSSIPNNEEILQEVRSQTNIKSITDMWTNLNVSSRLEAAEAGIGRLSSLVQDLIRDMEQEKGGPIDLKDRPSSVQQLTVPTSAEPAPAKTAPPPAETALLPAVTKDDLRELRQTIRKTQDELDELRHVISDALNTMQPGIDSSKPPATPIKSDIGAASTRHKEVAGVVTGAVAERLADLERRFETCCDRFNKRDDNEELLNSLQGQVDYLLKEVENLSSICKGAGAGLSPDLMKDLQGLMQLFQTVQDMQEQLKQVHQTALQLAAEKESRQCNINSLLEQIEMLKTVKLDREDMAEAMADKADLRMLARKVSHDQFEMACDDLSRGLEHAIGKLGMQEALWQQALDDIQREIETKLDKMELTPVRDFFNNKLKQLQENLKQMASLRREAEAAGTKRKLMRDVNCISCDANAVMAMEAGPSMPIAKPLPPSTSMKPYLSYELDVIRKAQASQLPQRNMHDWENIDKQMAQSTNKQPQRVRSGTDKHLCNRYCGGSHTTTTPAQRVSRLGHFMKQWGPDVLPLSSGLAAGDDGRMYRVSGTEGANVGTGGAVESIKPTHDKEKDHDKRTELPGKTEKMSPECKCLESQAPFASLQSAPVDRQPMPIRYANWNDTGIM